REHPRHVGGALGLQLRERLDRVERGVRREDDVVAADELGVFGQRLGRHHVERGAAEMAALERGDQRRLADQRAARGVHGQGGPRAVLMSSAPGFILRNTSALNSPRVAGMSGAWTETKSAVCNSRSKLTPSTPAAASTSDGT